MSKHKLEINIAVMNQTEPNKYGRNETNKYVCVYE